MCIKNIEIPSTPTVKLKFEYVPHEIMTSPWKPPIDLWKPTHIAIESTKEIPEKISDICLISNLFHEGTRKRRNIPIRGEAIMYNRRFFIQTLYRIRTYLSQLRRLVLYPTKLKVL